MRFSNHLLSTAEANHRCTSFGDIWFLIISLLLVTLEAMVVHCVLPSQAYYFIIHQALIKGVRLLSVRGVLRLIQYHVATRWQKRLFELTSATLADCRSDHMPKSWQARYSEFFDTKASHFSDTLISMLQYSSYTYSTRFQRMRGISITSTQEVLTPPGFCSTQSSL